MKVYNCLSNAIKGAEFSLQATTDVVNTGHWQGVDVSENQDMDTFEVLHYSFKAPVPDSVKELDMEVKPNQPWAENHFLERVAGVGVNPGETYKEWPFYKHRKENDKFRTENEMFTHTYMERYWPNHITNGVDDNRELKGVRYRYGDLRDLIDLLHRQPHTRQAYLPVWFPEDTGAFHQGRVPCTLGYHFIHRNGNLDIVYYIRSCDLVRHFKDDVYLTGRLLQWVIGELQERSYKWTSIKPGALVMHITSLHMFRADRRALGWEK